MEWGGGGCSYCVGVDSTESSADSKRQTGDPSAMVVTETGVEESEGRREEGGKCFYSFTYFPLMSSKQSENRV